jgi:hypothetical protein
MSNTHIPDHDFSSFGHFKRVIDLLNSREAPPRNQFYAAYELRCGIEARLRQYLNAQKDIPKKLKEGWRIASLARGAEKHFQSRDHILRFQLTNKDTRHVCVLLYTPVNSRLQKMGEQLGNYLHNQYNEKTRAPEWWNKLQTLIADTTVELYRANIGTLLGPALVKDNGARIDLAHSFSHQKALDTYMKEFAYAGCSFEIDSSWHKSFDEFDVHEVFDSQATPYFETMAKWIGKEG